MNIQRHIQKSEKLIQWMDNKIDGLVISSDDKVAIAATCFDIALEHQKSIVLLIAHQLVGTGFSIVRLLFEAYIRGLWLLKCASVKEIKKFKEKDRIDKNFGALIADIEKTEGFQEGVLSKIKSESWRAMNSYTHSGYAQFARRLTSDSVQPNYDEGEIIDALKFANIIGMLTAQQIAFMAGNVELAQELLLMFNKEFENPNQ